MKKINPSEITSPALFAQRRRIIKTLAAAPALGMATPMISARAAVEHTTPAAYSQATRGYDALTPEDKAKSYNNFYELGTGKEDPAFNHDLYSPTPWQLAVEGEVHKPRVFDLDDLRRLAPLEERVYRLRCVEAWSMVIPWLGYSLSHLVRAVEPTGNAKYVQFLTFNPEDLYPERMFRSLPWPYSEGLRLDEAMHPLTLLAFGMYGDLLPTQNGAPVRMMIPWKYGFKSGKALVTMRFTESQPNTSWNDAQPGEYGFYANVNPTVDHPRWSQASERVISDSFLPKRRDTDMFNGYADEVASLYAGMDLAANY